MTGSVGEGAPTPHALPERVREAGFGSPLLVVAGCADVARRAPVWAAALAGAGFVHRVRVASGSGVTPTRGEIDDIGAEAESLGAALVVVVEGAGGAGDAAAFAARLADVSGLPTAVWCESLGTLSPLPAVR